MSVSHLGNMADGLGVHKHHNGGSFCLQEEFVATYKQRLRICHTLAALAHQQLDTVCIHGVYFQTFQSTKLHVPEEFHYHGA